MDCPKCGERFDVFTTSNKVIGYECMFCGAMAVTLAKPSKKTINKIHQIISEEEKKDTP